MKKLMTLMLAAFLCLAVFPAALMEAEAPEPAGTDASANGTLGLESAEAAATAGTVEPQGLKLYQYEPVTNPDWGYVYVKSAEFTDVAQAIDAAEDSAKLTPSDGNIMLDIKLVFSARSEELLMNHPFDYMLVVDGEAFTDGRLMIESRGPSMSLESCARSDANCRERLVAREYESVETLSYLVNVSGDNRNFGTLRDISIENIYYMYDYIAELPASVAHSSTPVFLQLGLGEVPYYFQIQ